MQGSPYRLPVLNHRVVTVLSLQNESVSVHVDLVHSEHVHLVGGEDSRSTHVASFLVLLAIAELAQVGSEQSGFDLLLVLLHSCLLVEVVHINLSHLRIVVSLFTKSVLGDLVRTLRVQRTTDLRLVVHRVRH